MKHSTRALSLAGLCAATVALPVVAGVAGATDPPPAPVAQTLVDRANLNDGVHLNEDRIKLDIKDGGDVRFQKVTYGPDSRSGWHTHPGFVVVAVASGTITAFDADCETMTYGPNDVFVEYGDSAMQLGNLTATDTVLYATFVVPDGSPFRVNSTSPPPCDS